MSRIQEKFLKCWDDFNLNGSIAFLKVCEDQTLGKNLATLPSNLTPEERLRATQAHHLRKKKTKLQYQLDKQENTIRNLMADVEQYRNRMAERIADRKQARQAIDQDQKNMSKSNQDLQLIKESLSQLED